MPLPVMEWKDIEMVRLMKRTWPDKSSVMQNCCNVSCSAQAAGNNRIAVQMAGFTGTMGLADVKSVDWMVFQTTVLDQAHSCPL